MKLCEKCREGNTVTGAKIWPWVHCHHDEENPLVKDPCWCDYYRKVRNESIVSIRAPEGEPNLVWKILFCPACGKEMIK